MEAPFINLTWAYDMKYYSFPFPFVLSVVTDRRSVTKSKDEQKTASFDFGALRLRSGRTVFENYQAGFRVAGAPQ
jgi:hypothetical protein